MRRSGRISSRLRFGLTITAGYLLLAGCGGGGNPAPGTTTSADAGCETTAAECGTVLVAVTDAEGDFTTYTVDVLSIALERADGSRVETLPATTRVDFARLTELSELLSAATLAPGVIVGGHIRLDYTDAEVFVEAGGDIVPATIVDADGTPLGVVDVAVRLDERNRLVVTRGRTQLLQIDFDLGASHSVDTGTVPAIVTADPFLVAEVSPAESKALRVRGALVGVDTANASYRIRVRPWFSRIGEHGVVTVATGPTTAFEIDGAAYAGQAGIDALATKAAGTITVAFGTLDIDDRSFTAEVVHAGDSVGGDLFTAIHGNIVSRDGDRLTVKGALAVRRDRPAHFHSTVVVDVGPDTGVARRGDPTMDFDAGDLSVGQRIVAFGELIGPSASGDTPTPTDAVLVLDATAGRVRMLPTSLYGTARSVVPGQIDLTLRGIDRLGAAMFDFTGTGTSPATDADPANYEVATGTLPLDAVEVDRPVRVIGFVAAFGEAPPDFSGHTIAGPRTLHSALGTGWVSPGTSAPFSTMGPASVVIDLANPAIGERHHLLTGLTVTDLFDLPASPSIEPAASGGTYGITSPGHVTLYSDFASFVDELAIRLGGGDRARALAAFGPFAESANTLTSERLVVHLRPAE